MSSEEIATKADIQRCKEEILSVLTEMQGIKLKSKKWLRSCEVQKMLGISASGLQNLRIKRLIPFSKLNGTLYYDEDAIQDALVKNVQGHS